MKTSRKTQKEQILDRATAAGCTIDNSLPGVKVTLPNGDAIAASFTDQGKFLGSFVFFGDGGGGPGPMKFREMLSVFEPQKEYPLVTPVDGDQVAVGAGVTILGFTDRYPATIVDVINDKTIVVRHDSAELAAGWRPETVVGGFAGHTVNNKDQQWVINQDVNGALEIYTLRDNGKWVLKGQTKNGQALIIGQRIKFYDYNF